jgi:hypothetical protein
MEDKKTAVFGIYSDVTQAERGVDALVQERFSHADISVLAPDRQGTKDFRSRKAHQRPRKARRPVWRLVARSAARSGCWPASARSPFPGSDLHCRWPIMARWLDSASAVRSAAWWERSSAWAIPEYEAKRYEGRVKDGGVLLSVHCSTSDAITRAKAVLEQTGATISPHPVRRPVKSRTPRPAIARGCNSAHTSVQVSHLHRSPRLLRSMGLPIE